MDGIWIRDAVVCNERSQFEPCEVLIAEDRILGVGQDLEEKVRMLETVTVLDAKGMLITPGFVDVHVHLRDPGYTQKETIRSGSEAAALGGYTTIVAMPNVKPTPNQPDRIRELVQRAQKEAVIRTYFYSPITEDLEGNTCVPFAEMLEAGACAFSDDGHGVQDVQATLEAMRQIQKVGGILAEHCEEESLLQGGYIHSGTYAAEHGHPGILHAVEEVMTGRDLLLAAETGVAYHLCHVSTSRCCDLLALAKRWGVDATGEVTPHHLLLTDSDLQEDGNWKMNPPLRTEADRQSLVAALRDGTLGIVATDHAPHTQEEKERGLAGSPFGIIGLETAFALLYSRLVCTGELPLRTLLDAMSTNPAERFHLPGGRLEVGSPADCALIDLNQTWTIDPEHFASKGRNTPFAGWTVQGRIHTLFCRGRCVVQGAELTGNRYEEDEEE